MPVPCSSAPTKISTLPRKVAATASLSPDQRSDESVMTVLGKSDAAMARAAQALLARFGIVLNIVDTGAAIPGTFWGEPEAGIIGADLYARADTPVHSVLHEACHFICMDPARRSALHTNAGGTAIEECGVCYLSIILADELADFSRSTMCRDMDRWGYSFRLGSSTSWFEEDATDAEQWLREHDLLDPDGVPTWQIRT